MSYCIIRDGMVTIPSTILRWNGMRGAEITENSGYTPWGYVIHVTDGAFNVLDFLETGEINGTFNTVVIDRQGDVYELMCEGPTVGRRRIPFDYTKGTYVRAHDSEIEKGIRTGVYLKHSTEKILQTLSEINVRYRFAFTDPLVIPIADILANMRKIWPTGDLRPIPNKPIES